MHLAVDTSPFPKQINSPVKKSMYKYSNTKATSLKKRILEIAANDSHSLCLLETPEASITKNKYKTETSKRFPQ